jgi:hypothetical protein
MPGKVLPGRTAGGEGGRRRREEDGRSVAHAAAGAGEAAAPGLRYTGDAESGRFAGPPALVEAPEPPEITGNSLR